MTRETPQDVLARGQPVDKLRLLIHASGLSQQDFAKRAGVHRNTVQKIVRGQLSRLRNATLVRCAQALGLSLHQLISRPTEELSSLILARGTKTLDLAEQPALQTWIRENPERAASFSPDELEELASHFGTGGSLTAEGVEHYARVIERRRALLYKVSILAQTAYLDLLEELVESLYRRVQVERESFETSAAMRTADQSHRPT